jgi:uncharacterized membrane protein
MIGWLAAFSDNPIAMAVGLSPVSTIGSLLIYLLCIYLIVFVILDRKVDSSLLLVRRDILLMP